MWWTTTMLSFLRLISLFQLFFIPFPVLYANEFNRYNLSLSNNFSHPRQEAERLIASFNLFPIKEINNPSDTPYDVDRDGHITEKEFRFPIITDPSAEGRHYAGFYQVPDTNRHYAGFYQVPKTEGSRLFYYFITSQNPIYNESVVLWLTGGPGCSSSIAMFYENGPYRINGDLSLTPNKYSWHTLSNIIFIDQPIGTGYSTITDKKYMRHEEDAVADDLDGFLQAFFRKHTELALSLRIAGESYGGHYVPALAYLLNEKNNGDDGRRIIIQLKGIAIGNGLTHPIIQYQAYGIFALYNGLINYRHYETIMTVLPRCTWLVQNCAPGEDNACLAAFNECNMIFQYILKVAGNVNYYDITKKCDGPQCYDFSAMDKYLNKREVIEALGVNTQFVSCSKAVYLAMETDWMNNLAVKIPTLLKANISVLIYAGVEDLICNWLGNFWWVQEIDWEYIQEFRRKPFHSFQVHNEEKGKVKRVGPLTFFKMFKAGHMVPMDQPEPTWYMLCRWMEGSLGNELETQTNSLRTVGGSLCNPPF